MKLTEAQQLALSLMREHGLIEKGWTFQFDKAVRRFGCCYQSSKRITLSKALVELNEESIVKNTILHEIAHALVGAGVGHSWIWKQKAIQIGCSGERCYSSEVVRPKAKYSGSCPNCNRQIARNKRMDLACGKCCRLYNNNQYDIKYKIKWS